MGGGGSLKDHPVERDRDQLELSPNFVAQVMNGRKRRQLYDLECEVLPGSEVVKEVFDRFHYLDQDGRDLVKNLGEILHNGLFK